MAREIENYQDLQDAIKDWLNRPDLVDRIPTFIYLAERKIFRRYRAPNNEKTITYDQRSDPDSQDPLQLSLSEKLALPSDYLETLTLQADGFPMTRVSLTELQRRQYNSAQTNAAFGANPPEIYARSRWNIEVFPSPVGDTLFTQIYYCDLTGLFVESQDDVDVLRTAPDLYLYGALLQAEPFLKPETDEASLLGVWKKFYSEGFAEIEFQRDEDERSGSNVEVKSSFV